MINHSFLFYPSLLSNDRAELLIACSAALAIFRQNSIAEFDFGVSEHFDLGVVSLSNDEDEEYFFTVIPSNNGGYAVRMDVFCTNICIVNTLFVFLECILQFISMNFALGNTDILNDAQYTYILNSVRASIEQYRTDNIIELHAW